MKEGIIVMCYVDEFVIFAEEASSIEGLEKNLVNKLRVKDFGNTKNVWDLIAMDPIPSCWIRTDTTY